MRGPAIYGAEEGEKARPPAEGTGSAAVVGRDCEPSWRKVSFACLAETAYIRDGEGRDLPSMAGEARKRGRADSVEKGAGFPRLPALGGGCRVDARSHLLSVTFQLRARACTPPTHTTVCPRARPRRRAFVLLYVGRRQLVGLRVWAGSAR